MEKQFPKNVRQIGNVSDTPKIYVEDYVDTFLNQLCTKVDQEPVAAILIGQALIQEEQECVYISGAIQVDELEQVGPDVGLGEKSLNKVREKKKEFFDSGELIGWFLAAPGQPLGVNSNIKKVHEQYFGVNNSIFIMKDPVEKDEQYFAYKYKELMQMGGHYIYYEKNPSMQNYMITQRKQMGVTPSEMVTDRAAKDFRSIIKDKTLENHRNQNTKWTYAASTFLVLVVLVIGVTMINNYDKMQAVQSSLDEIKATVSDNQSERKPLAVPVEDEEVDNNTAQEDVEAVPEAPDATKADDSKEQEEKVKEASSTGTYTVKSGDTLAKISLKIYGDRDHIQDIKELNEISGDNLIYVGQKILLP